jgi:predicted HTH transcriptional regulator
LAFPNFWVVFGVAQKMRKICLKSYCLRKRVKTLEFKENTYSLANIIQTIVAFANTAGGTIVIGVKDKTKEVVGLKNILMDEERIANSVADSIEQWGSGFGRMMHVCKQQGILPPKYEELGNFFRITLYHEGRARGEFKEWQEPIIQYLIKHKEIYPKKAQELWGVTQRTTGTRLRKMCDEGVIAEIATSPFDPQKRFVLRGK